MGIFRAAMGKYADPALLGQPAEWQKFLEDMITAHEADLAGMEPRVLARSTSGASGVAQKGLPLKDLKPDKFESAKRASEPSSSGPRT